MPPDAAGAAVNRSPAASVLKAGTAATTAGAVASRKMSRRARAAFRPGFKTWLPPLATLPNSLAAGSHPPGP